MNTEKMELVNFYPSFNQSVEITDKAFYLLRGDDRLSAFLGRGSNELSEWTLYINEGVKLMSIYNFVSNITQYYVQDINA